MANMTGRKLGKWQKSLNFGGGGNKSGMNYYANILSVHQMLRQIHAFKLVLEANGKFDR